MKKENIAVLLTCHNRKDKTVTCLASFYNATIPSNYTVDVYLTDDGCTDDTVSTVKELFPEVYIIKGNGNLFWAGGMRLAWKKAIEKKEYDAYILLNDDVVLKKDFFHRLLEADAYALSKTGKSGIYSGAMESDKTGEITYGGARVHNYLFIVRFKKVTPIDIPQECDLTNANLLWVSKGVVNELGILDHRFTHGIADYDYTLFAKKNNFPILLAPGVCGTCIYDHGENWKNSKSPLKERIAYLKSPTGLAYREYLYYVNKFFPFFVPYSFIMLWMKTLFPFIWDRFKPKESIGT